MQIKTHAVVESIIANGVRVCDLLRRGADGCIRRAVNTSKGRVCSYKEVVAARHFHGLFESLGKHLRIAGEVLNFKRNNLLFFQHSEEQTKLFKLYELS